MNSPFPGMDPYLERHWPDVHSALAIGARNQLNQMLPDDLIARVEERVSIESDGDDPAGQASPDIGVLEVVEALGTERGSARAGEVSLAPYRLTALIEPTTERFIEIREASGERLITVIELLSPANKRGKGLQEFRQKREKLLEGNVNFVEVDLVRAGDWRKLLRPHSLRNAPPSAYRVTVRAVSDPGAVHYYPVFLREALPAIKIPLRRDDQPVELELQPLMEQVYVNGRYARSLDYAKSPDPPLDSEDAAWADELLKIAGKR